MNVLPPQSVVEWLLTPSNWLSSLGVLAGLAIIVVAIRGLARGRKSTSAIAAPSTGRRLRLEDLTSRWQLMLLGTAALLLSIASGYRVWEGMTNFTNEKHLSLMITFGLQGVMLIVAWLIGESFASGMNRRLPNGRHTGVADSLIGIVLAILVVGVTFYWVLYSAGTFSFNASGLAGEFNWGRFADVSAYFALGLIVLGVLAFNFARGGDLSLPYVQSVRIIIKNAMLWMMFLACMSAAVFFSFDSLFASIFPKEERARAAQLRAQNQVAGMVADIGTTIDKRRSAELTNLFDPANKGWAAYDSQLTKLAQGAQNSQREIEDYFNSQLEDKNRSIKQQQERIASAQSGSAGLIVRKNSLTDELSRLKGERPSLATDFAEKKSELDNRAKGVDAKRVEAQAEDRGAEGTLKQGKGPMYRQIMTDLARLQDAYKIQETRVKDAQQRLTATDQRIAQLERELAAVDGDIAKLKGEAETAQQRIKLTQEAPGDDNQPRVDPTRILAGFEKVRLEFRQEPTRDRLTGLHQQCGQLFSALAGTPATRDRVRGIDCDPKQATEAAAVMFALNDGQRAFERTCIGGDKLEALNSTDALYSFVRKCLADSGLPAKETDELRGKINFLELTRDDKAHPFVASLNAFQDGNRLAYLALGIAIIMESLVFMAGLFGATAVRSPLSDVPSMKARSGKDLEKLVETSLGEEHERYDHARIVFQRLRPSSDPDYSMQVSLSDLGPTEAEVVLPVLSAGREIGAVTPHPDRRDTYLVRGELFAFIAKIANRKVAHHSDEAREHELKKILLSALQPFIGDHADIVLHQCRPISERNGFSAEVYLSRMPADDVFIVSKVLNAGATLNYVQLDERPDQDQRYYVHKQLYKTLLLISSAANRTGQRSRAPQLAGPSDAGTVQGGELASQAPSLDAPRRAPALTHATRSAGSAGEDEVRSEETDLRQYFIDSMVEGLGIRPELYSGISGETWGAAQAASDAFKAVQRTNRLLRQLLEDKESAAQGTIDLVYDRLAGSLQGQSPLSRSSLDAAYDDVNKNLPIIVLLPNGPVERELRSVRQKLEKQFESDMARLNPEEEHLLNLVRRLESNIVQSGRTGAEDWRQMHQGLMQGPFAVWANRAARPGSA